MESMQVLLGRPRVSLEPRPSSPAPRRHDRGEEALSGAVIFFGAAGKGLRSRLAKGRPSNAIFFGWLSGVTSHAKLVYTFYHMFSDVTHTYTQMPVCCAANLNTAR